MGPRLRELRERAGLSQEELGRIIGVRDVTISRYESGKRGIDSDLLVALARALGVSPCAFFEEEPAPLPDPQERLARELLERFERRLEEKLAPLYELLRRRPSEPGRPGRALTAEEVEEAGTEYLARELARSLLELPDEEFGHLMKRALAAREE